MFENKETDQVAYLLGTSGSLILACSKCGEEHFRSKSDYWFRKEPIKWEKCFTCGTQMEPIRMDELENRWKPFWRSLGWKVSGDPDFERAAP